MPRRKEPRIPDAVLDQLLAGADPKTAFDPNGLIDDLKKALAERVLNAEMDHHLAGEEPGDRRNGYGKKTVITDTGQIELAVPRDRQASFDPQLIAKCQRRFPGFDDKILGCGAERGIIEDSEIFFNGAAGCVKRQARGSRDTGAVAGIGLDQTGVDSEPFATDQPLGDAALQHALEQTSQQVALTKAAVAVLREGRVVGHRAIEPELAEPPVRQVEVHLLAQPPLRADAEAVADDQHADHQLRIDRGPTNGAVKRRQFSPQPIELNKPINRPQPVSCRHVPFERKLVKQRALLDSSFPHHRLHSSPQRPE